MSLLQDKIFKLKGKVQHYAWGGYDYIPHWLGVNNDAHKPCAEYWMGAHPSASSVIEKDGKEISLNELIKQHPAETISQKVFDAFGELPYLFKILDVKDMLSIQVHPTKAEAGKGYDAEEAAGILLSAPHRNYKDRNHKPEVMVALSDFWLLHGFKSEEKLSDTLTSVAAFKGMDEVFKTSGYKGLYKHVMEMPQAEVNTLLMPLVNDALQQKAAGKLNKTQPEWWVCKLFDSNEVKSDLDRGIFSIYFFNIVNAKEGEAVFQGAGIPHAYLEGQNVELMANSDNVLRGGLTPKHVDVPELLKHTAFEPVIPNIMEGDELKAGERIYPCPVPDFGISKIDLYKDDAYTATTSSMEILVVMEGSLTVKGSVTVEAHKGEVVGILANETYSISTTGHVVAYKAFVP
jgi:mannose-6-phosphate isomerase